MTSFNGEPGPSNPLNNYLLELSGYSKSDALRKVEPKLLTKDHAEYVWELMTGWLPSLLDTYKLSSDISHEYADYNRLADGIICEEVTQEWGDIPQVVDMHLTGKILEVAGPSLPKDYSKFLGGFIPRIITNIDPDLLDVDVAADAANAPFKNESIGTLFVSDLPGAQREYVKQYNTLRSQAITEATRIIKPEGYFIWLGGTTSDVQDILNSGFVPEYLQVKSYLNKLAGSLPEQYTSPFITVDGVYKKVANSNV